uniref:Choline/carnitine acyltransferase domain-containing protein n=1 Tax=Oreochromis aureus TaxID=47969 RepID=A0A668T6Z5_OREAU
MLSNAPIILNVYADGMVKEKAPTLIRPFTSEKDFKATEETVRKFQAGVGQELHKKLLQRAKTKKNWLEEWWLDTAYLEVRIPSQLNVNFGGPAPYLEHCWPPAEGTYLQRASIITWHTLQYWNLLRTERLAPQKAGKTPLDMDQFRMLFCTCKVLGVKKDTIRNYFKTGRINSALIFAANLPAAL